jgi:competence protein ComEC
MLATVSVLRLSGVRWPWPQVWLLACAVVVAVDPWALLQAGFWLSFVAVGVLFVSDRGPAQVQVHSGQRTLVSRIAQALWHNGREQWVITLALAPLTLLWFGQLSIVGLLANALAIPWVTLVITPLSMAGVAVPGLWQAAAWSVQGMIAVLQAMAGLPWATYSAAMVPWWLGATGVLAGVMAVGPWPWSLRFAGCVMALPILFWQSPAPAQGGFELLFADVGQGNAVLVRTAHHALLYDAGPRYSLESDAGHRVVVPLLSALQVKLDRVVLSHRDTDHVGGASAVLQMQPQADVLSSIEADHSLQLLRPAKRCYAGQSWEWDGVRFSVLHPLAQDYQSPRKPNAMSCVLRIDNGVQSALLVGDIEKEQEARLVQQASALRSTVLLVPHHGSKTSSSAEFLDAVQPHWALVQSGYRNRFGHPAPSVMSRYAERNIVVRDSPHCGAGLWSSDAPGGMQCTRLEQLRYWHHRVP